MPLESRHVVVRGVRIHYVEQGTGPPVLFVHGNPTWSYIWRNVLPATAGTHRAIALDLMGFGRSEHPPGSRYDVVEHAAVIEAFIGELGLQHLSLVLHDWGGILGMDYAVRHQANVDKVVLMSTFLAPPRGRLNSLLMRVPRVPGIGWLAVERLNLFLPLALRAGIARPARLSQEIRRSYAEPFPTAESRRSIRRFTEQLPVSPADESYAMLTKIAAELPAFDRPVLILKGRWDPILSMRRARWLARTLPHARVEVIDGAGHFLQEDQPARVAELVASHIRGDT